MTSASQGTAAGNRGGQAAPLPLTARCTLLIPPTFCPGSAAGNPWRNPPGAAAAAAPRAWGVWTLTSSSSSCPSPPPPPRCGGGRPPAPSSRRRAAAPGTERFAWLPTRLRHAAPPPLPPVLIARPGGWGRPASPWPRPLDPTHRPAPPLRAGSGAAGPGLWGALRTAGISGFPGKPVWESFCLPLRIASLFFLYFVFPFFFFPSPVFFLYFFLFFFFPFYLFFFLPFSTCPC